jgi:hypothetical protein
VTSKPWQLLRDRRRNRCQGGSLHDAIDWVVRSEPTVDDRLGITITNRKGKALLIGIGDLVEGATGYYFAAQGQEVFQWRKASPSSCAHTNYAVRNPGTTPVKLMDAPPDGGT